MPLHEFHDAQAFANRVRDFLLQREAECCVELGMLSFLTGQTSRAFLTETLRVPRLWLVETDAGEIDALFMQSSKDRAIVTRGSDDAMRTIARKMLETDWREKSINGNSPSVQALVREYSELTGRVGRCVIDLRVFKLVQVIPPRSAPGKMRRCDDCDREVLSEWTVSFARDVGDEVVAAKGEKWAAMLLEDRRAWFWIDQNEHPVAMAAHAGPTPNGIRVNFVYTPPEARGNGYASNLVAALSQFHLDSGKKFIFLHTDQANPTSNNIYQKIGYQPVCDAQRWDF